MSAQSPADQAEFAAREHMPYPLIADPDLKLAAALDLPTFDIAGMRLYRRITLIARAGRIEHVFYPVFPPDRNAADVVAWLQPGSTSRSRTAYIAAWVRSVTSSFRRIADTCVFTVFSDT